MPTHDCSRCTETKHCPITGISPWLNDHEEEVDRATKDQSEELAKVCTVISMAAPIVMIIPGADDAVIVAVGMAFDLGYSKGRQYPTVPNVYEVA